MRLALIATFLHLSFLANANWCDSTSATTDPKKMGSITYGVGNENCLSDKNQTLSCYDQIEKDSNFCKSKSVLVQYYCDQKKPGRRELVCPNDSVCIKGLCQKP